MSRIGKLPIQIPEGVKINIQDSLVEVESNKGKLSENIHPDMKIVVKENEIQVERPSDSRTHKSLHGLSRTLIQNMVVGLTDGYEKKLEIVGVGYRAEIKGKALVLMLGFSHPIYFVPPEEIQIETPTQTSIVIKGIDKQLVGEIAAKIREFRPPEPYKGKGVRYENEHIRRKVGKANV